MKTISEKQQIKLEKTLRKIRQKLFDHPEDKGIKAQKLILKIKNILSPRWHIQNAPKKHWTWAAE